MGVSSPSSCGAAPSRRGFTLIEAAIAQMIVAVAVVAMCQLLATGTSLNVAAAEMSAAVRLAHPVHELALGMELRQAAELDGQVFSPPIDVSRTPLPNLDGWEQRVSATALAGSDASSGPLAVRLQVEMYHHQRFVYRATWLLFAPAERCDERGEP